MLPHVARDQAVSLCGGACNLRRRRGEFERNGSWEGPCAASDEGGRNRTRCIRRRNAEPVAAVPVGVCPPKGARPPHPRRGKPTIPLAFALSDYKG